MRYLCQKRNPGSNLALLAAALLLAACDTQEVDRGHTDLLEKLPQIKAHETTKGQVQQILGSPTAKSQFGDERWYYLTSHRQTIAFLPPDITDQQTLQISFKDDIVDEMHQFAKKDGKDIEISQNITPTYGSSYGFFEQLFSNLGKFNKKRDPLAAARNAGAN